jgi:GNAT superfamily N-acetyltransferase
LEFRKAVKSDIDEIMNIIKQAQVYFKKNGIDQWQDNYPNYEIIAQDICNENGYVILKNNIIVGTLAVSFDGEKNYSSIYDGKWISNEEYAVIHRIAIKDDYKGFGLSSIFLNHVEKICLNKNVYSIKIDTHEENKSMQNFLKKNKFQYCGIIYLQDKSKRLAFEKIL